MAFGLSKSGKQVFTANGTWTHPLPGVPLLITITAVGGGGGGSDLSSISSPPIGTPPATAGGTTTVVAGATTLASAQGGGVYSKYKTTLAYPSHYTNAGSLGFGSFGLGGTTVTNTPSTPGQNGECVIKTVSATGNLTVTIGAGGSGGTTNAYPFKGYPGIVIIEW